MSYALTLLLLILVYAIAAKGLDLAVGHAGLLVVCQGGFLGLGAYVAAVALARYDAPHILALVLSILVSGVLGLLLGACSLSLRDEYFVLLTFALQVVLVSMFTNLDGLTGGPSGFGGIPSVHIASLPFNRVGGALLLAGLVGLMVYIFVETLVASPFGRILHVVREDRVLAEVVGKRPIYYLTWSFCIMAATGALAGVVYASGMSFIQPGDFSIFLSVNMLGMVIIGGIATRWGPLLGAAVFVVLPELLRFAGASAGAAANLREMAFGCILVGTAFFRPEGLRSLRQQGDIRGES